MIVKRFAARLYLLIGLLVLTVYLLYSYPEPLHYKFHELVPRLQWGSRQERYPISSYIPLPTGKPVKLPPIQNKFPAETKDAKKERLERWEAVKEGIGPYPYSFGSGTFAAYGPQRVC